jgi:hypothetical protein
MWNSDGMIVRGKKLKDLKKTCPCATLFTANPTWTDLGTSPGLHVENSATKCLSYGMVHKIMIFIKRQIQDARKIIPYVFE